MRLTKTCASRSGSASTRTGRSAASSSETPLFEACCSNEATIGRATSSRSTSRRSSLSCPDSARACSSSCPTSAVKPVDLRERLRHEEIASFFFGRLEHRFEHQLDRRERRAQLVRNVREKLFARAIEPNERRLIVGKHDDAARLLAVLGQADRPRRDRCAGPTAPVSISGATEASPRNASAIRRSSSTFGIASMTWRSIARVRIETEDRSRRGVGELDAAVAVDEHDADRQRPHQPLEGALVDRRRPDAVLGGAARGSAAERPALPARKDARHRKDRRRARRPQRAATTRAASSFEHVAAAAHRQNVARRARIFFDLLAQPANVHADRLLLAFEIVSPHLVEQRLARHDAAVVLHQHAQQPELFGRERDVLAANRQLLPRRIEDDLAERDRFVVPGLDRRSAGAAAPSRALGTRAAQTAW